MLIEAWSHSSSMTRSGIPRIIPSLSATTAFAHAVRLRKTPPCFFTTRRMGSSPPGRTPTVCAIRVLKSPRSLLLVRE